MRRTLAIVPTMLAVGGCVSVAHDPILVGTNEPFWSLRIERDTIRVTTIEVPDGVVYPIVGRTGDSWRAESGVSAVSVSITPGPCFDDMSGARFPLSASVTLDGRTNRGCARRASDPRPDPA